MFLPDAQLVPLLKTHLSPGYFSEMIWLQLWECRTASAIHLVIYLFPTLPRPLAAFSYVLRTNVRFLARGSSTLQLVRGSFCLLLLSSLWFFFFKLSHSFWDVNLKS